MAIIRCKMCGGKLEITEGKSVCTCEYCGTEQTLPRLDSEIKANLYDRANHFRRNNDFDKAMEIYEQILNIDDTDAEAYWSLILCGYGIEYVEDPATHRRLSTINRAQYTSIYADENYKAALKYASSEQKSIYEQEAKTIDEIQKDILAISSKEKPFDVFICYKETDDAGRRTPDSVLANDLYHQLTQEGFKVFFARITLEDKLGCEYEPYIFAALNSAKVMVVLGTRPEYFKAVWVRNEWSRFLALIRAGEKKVLIPAFKDMDPYDLPEEFSHLQAQDMSKLGFMQDLIHGISKIVVADQPHTVVEETVVYANEDESSVLLSLIARGNMALEEGDWQKADIFFEEALNQDAECAEAYLGKLLAKKNVCNIKQLEQHYLSKGKETKIEKYEACPLAREHIDNAAEQYSVKKYFTKMDVRRVYDFDRYYDALLPYRKKQKSIILRELEDEKLLARAQKFAEGETKEHIDNMLENIHSTLEEQIELAEKLDNEKKEPIRIAYEKHIEYADKDVRQIYKEAKAQLRISLVIKAVLLLLAIPLTLWCINLFTTVSKNNSYNLAITYMQRGDYANAIARFQDLDGYKDSEEQIKKCRIRIKDEAYEYALTQMNYGYYSTAIDKFENLGGYKDSEALIEECRLAMNEYDYNKAVELMNKGDFEGAISKFESLDGYSDAKEQIDACNMAIENYDNAIKLMHDGNYIEAYEIFCSSNGYERSNDYIDIINNDYKWSILSTAEVGDTVVYGDYNGNTEWIVLDKEAEMVFVVSKYAIEQRSFNTGKAGIAWQSSTLRKWLNDTYLCSAFSGNEIARIMQTAYVSDGNSIDDRILLLSNSELDSYFISESDREVTLSDGTEVSWWLRTPGLVDANAMTVDESGCIDQMGMDVRSIDIAVRPAMWIDISDL